MHTKHFLSGKPLPGLTIFLMFLVHMAFSQETFTSMKYALWSNIKAFSINEEETMIVMEMVVNGRSMLYQSKKIDGNWQDALPISELNDFSGGTSNLGAPFLSYKGKLLFFDANYPDSKGGMDIYFSRWTEDKWSTPTNLGEPVNSIANDESPSITATNDKIYFTRDNPIPKTKRDKEDYPCKIIYSSVKDISGNWSSPVSLTDPINVDCEASPFIAPDGKTLYFSSIREKGESFDIYYTKEVIKDAWLIPQIVPGTISENDDLDPNYLNGNVFHINSFTKKKVYNGAVYFHAVPDEMKPSVTVNIEGRITDFQGNPLDATLQVLDPITSKLIGVFTSDQNTGYYSLPLLDKFDYIVNIRKDGYSFATYDLYLSQPENRNFEKQSVSLFNTINLDISTFDSEIFRPLSSDILVVNKETENRIPVNSTHVGDGVYRINLPIGNKYKIVASSPGFEASEMDFVLTDDIIYSQFERNMPLKPIKTEFKINVSDFETSENIAAEVVIRNLDRDETIIVSSEDIKSGKTSVMLREGDRYEFNIKGPKGYSFYNNTVDLKSETEKRSLDVELKPLSAQTTITLNNITFEKNSADLNEGSFAELNRVVSLIQDNTNLIVEISAHTDDIGSDQYNLKLSERRADSVVKYLVDNGVPVERLVAKGYGESAPVQPNTNDENRALNRRVEFKIVGFVNN